jgi:hypothetical protein
MISHLADFLSDNLLRLPAGDFWVTDASMVPFQQEACTSCSATANA